MNYDVRYNVWPGEPDGHPMFREPLRKHPSGWGIGFGGGVEFRVLVPRHIERGRPYGRLLNARRRRSHGSGKHLLEIPVLVRAALTRGRGSGNVTDAR